jgi:hypothetical protein
VLSAWPNLLLDCLNQRLSQQPAFKKQRVHCAVLLCSLQHIFKNKQPFPPVKE